MKKQPPVEGAGGRVRSLNRTRSLLWGGGFLSIVLDSHSSAQGQLYPVWEVQGVSANEGANSRIVPVGDLDGDGHAEFALGTPNASPGGTPGAGRVRVFSGASAGVLFTLLGTQMAEAFGFSLVGLGDASGDGIPDYLVGAPGADVGGNSDAGRVVLVSGADGGTLAVAAGVGNGEQFGWVAAAAGDVDGDGIEDCLVGAPAASPSGLPYAGTARLVSGATGAFLSEFDGSVPNGYFGSSLAGAEDIDGDGTPDLLAGSTGAGPTGEVRLFSGADASLLLVLQGASPMDAFGQSMAGLGDVSGDGVPDLVVGAPGVIPAGECQVFSGAGGALLYAAVGGLPFEASGYSLAAVGDVDADGVFDFLAGSPTATVGGVVRAGVARLFSGGDGTLLGFVGGGGSSENLGRAVAGGGDVNADGVPDLFVSSTNAVVLGRVLSATGIPAGSGLYGSACAGSGGILPRIGTMGGTPSAATGNPDFSLYVSNALGNGTALLVWGVTPLLPGVSLGGLGIPGCELWVSPDIFVFPVDLIGAGPGEGRARVPLPIPLLPGAVGLYLFFQFYVLDPGPLPIPGAMSQALYLNLV